MWAPCLMSAGQEIPHRRGVLPIPTVCLYEQTDQITGIRGTQELPAHSCEEDAFQLGTKLIPEKRLTTPLDQGTHWAPGGKQAGRRTMLGPEGAYGQVGQADLTRKSHTRVRRAMQEKQRLL